MAGASRTGTTRKTTSSKKKKKVTHQSGTPGGGGLQQQGFPPVTILATRVFVVEMSLYPSRGEPKAYEGIDERFTQEIARAWSCMVFNAAIGRSKLAEKLNAIIFAAFKTKMGRNSDIGETIYSAVGPVVSDTPWTPGGGGLHELRATVQGNTRSSGTPLLTPWNFRITDDEEKEQQVFVNVLVRFSEVDILS